MIVKKIHAHLHATKVDLQESQMRQHILEEQVASCEAELASDRELLDAAAQQSGIGVAGTISRNKKLKSTLQSYEVEIEKCHSDLAVLYRVAKRHLAT